MILPLKSKNTRGMLNPQTGIYPFPTAIEYRFLDEALLGLAAACLKQGLGELGLSCDISVHDIMSALQHRTSAECAVHIHKHGQQ